MQPDGPYRYTHLLGGSPVGKAWAAIDDKGRLVTVAVLDATVAASEGWREAFAGMVTSLAQGSDMAYTYADFSAAAPWVAYPAEAGPGAEKLFRSLGVEYTPVQTSPSPTSAPPVSAPPQPVSGAPEPTSGAPQPPWAAQAGAIPYQPALASHPISGAPASPAATGAGLAPSSPSPHPVPVDVTPRDPFASPVRRITPSGPPRRRTGLWIGAAALALVVLASAGAVALLSRGNDAPVPPVASTPDMAAPPPMPTAPPQSPGIEPPEPGAWPTQWPKFTERDQVQTLVDLEGVGFPVKVPEGWTCTLVARADGYVKYNCGNAALGNQLTGGELIVRNCPEPCNEQWQNAMRAVEEAWGAQWIRSGQYGSFAEQIIEIDGEKRHGLVVVAYFRSGEAGLINRQVVVRMTAPVPEAYQLRRFAGYIRDVTVF
ncbi:hypothetical protein SAMN05443287_110163 [Micromonospora phaseoli]|uniref:Uncharacterized protein n=1 Tax=Micromonospora phaseoli TaxID=1144548 RepID=A0A1H7CT92_9ACTN|nr:hypothetical protein [Micromonospora phaseoli]PZV91528.1 hypothetical protein CLV64_11147 [Micromonospora phaseoli]GIJ80064.1 hypothetical protein Xph01_44960 [Micromonospora phaseoli]SEJ92706.1 hypothetical protein SAMN05443287_110163 [Micromonospora phaseoli]